MHTHMHTYKFSKQFLAASYSYMHATEAAYVSITAIVSTMQLFVYKLTAQGRIQGGSLGAGDPPPPPSKTH